MDFEKARFNMIEQQIRPWDVLDTAILDLLFHVKREDFVTASQRTLAFSDVELPLPNGGYMLQPKMEARMIQDVDVAENDKVLEIGTGSGYVTTLLAKIARQVISLDINQAALEHAEQRIKDYHCSNIKLLNENGLLGYKAEAPYDVIFVGGSLPMVPEELKQQLSIGGRMIITVGSAPVMKMTYIERVAESAYKEHTLYETCLPSLAGSDVLQPSNFSF